MPWIRKHFQRSTGGRTEVYFSDAENNFSSPLQRMRQVTREVESLHVNFTEWNDRPMKEVNWCCSIMDVDSYGCTCASKNLINDTGSLLAWSRHVFRMIIDFPRAHHAIVFFYCGKCFNECSIIFSLGSSLSSFYMLINHLSFNYTRVIKMKAS